MPGKYVSTIENFLRSDNLSVLGHLALGVTNHQILREQRVSWSHQIELLKTNLINLPGDWGIILEYPIPRRSKRIDVILIARDIVFVIEFKDDETGYTQDAIYQVEDYALDIRDFHKESASKTIVPIVWATEAKEKLLTPYDNDDFVKPTLFSNKANLFTVVQKAFDFFTNSSSQKINQEKWNNSEYLPTPTIVEAAQYLFAGHNVKEISRAAAAENLTLTTDSILKAIANAQQNNEKIICFITGVPGSGKTLAGLNVVHNIDNNSGSHLGVFLSGNGPLVKVLSEALARDEAKRTKSPIGRVRHNNTFIQNAHQFFEFYYNNDQVPPDKIIVFDEAQRAWDAKQSKRKFKRDYSEAQMLLQIMSRQVGWSVIVALIGSGQEINTGEAGLAEWGRALNENFKDWKIYISPELKEGSHRIKNLKLFEKAPTDLSITELPELHLNVPLRSYKAELLSEWVDALLNDEPLKAKELLQIHLKDYPIYITRKLETARTFLHSKNRGHRRTGLVASSGARRLRPHGLDVTIDIDVAHWFLNSKNDVRSSCFLELPATEFAVQGLELDWVGLCWGDDFRKEETDWSYHSFKGTKWQIERMDERKQFILNKYRVLLTRGREGIIIWVPEGSTTDHTRPAKNYQTTYEYLKLIDIKEL